METTRSLSRNGNVVLRFNLKQTRERGRLTQIMLVATVEGKRLRAYTRLRVEPRYWDGRVYRCRVEACANRREQLRLRQINDSLNRMEALVDEADGQLAERGERLTAEVVRRTVRRHQKKVEDYADGNPLEYLQQLVEQYATGVNRKGKRGVESTRDTYRRALDRLERYVRACGRLPASFEDFDKHFFAGFTEYLYNYTYGRGARQKKYTQNTIMNTLKVIKNLLHRAYDLEATTNNYFLKVQTALPSDVSQQVYLDEREVRRLGEVRVDSDEEREVRDMFVIASYTALRISDLQRLGQAIIGHGVIALYQSKTKDLVEIPILKEIAPLVEHYRQTGFPVLKKTRANHIIKRLAARCHLDEPVSRKEHRGGVVQVRTWRKCELVSFHTARRSCITNLYKRGYPVNYIMLLSGHRSMQAFQRYMRASSQELMGNFFRLLKKDKAI